MDRVFFFFKQKTADEMVSSDCSSYVCSSDLLRRCRCRQGRPGRPAGIADSRRSEELRRRASGAARAGAALMAERFRFSIHASDGAARTGEIEMRRGTIRTPALMRSEEHTSELQSLMRISYAVCCLQQKKPSTHR